ncbi:SAM-dependent methyltransferase [Kineosphaera limosa]|uniref:Putative methyltransferase n=1 Tax=Kineosphaera limosa NBRC 100340 TaxID=1184609 RepID=K6VCS1_9MICO|nr:class I SAM-dependent methyltransferase [Kineosphaera limosa]NYE02166.1 SAM-dependent methyltransferase [Kineosphaera limosa]GAB94018.1 putative methyltransferase [Kineosphaera limosa NBRC 100340]
MPESSASLPCRICGAPLTTTFVDLGASPPCEAILTREESERGESAYPLHVRICDECLLVQLPEVIPAEEIFTDEYAYFSSFSTSWIEHARRYAEAMIERLELGPSSFVVEVASNDGYLLRHFRDAGIPCLGVEPTANTAAAAREQGIETEVVFLGEATGTDIATRHRRADLVVANNVYAHVPDLADFTKGLAALLAPTGTLTMEFPHLARLIDERQYDTIYHEHFQYYTLLTAQRAVALGGLTVVDVDELSTHGGSLRIYCQHADAAGEPSAAVTELLAREEAAGLHSLAGHAGFEEAVRVVKRDLLRFLLDAQEQGERVVGYGAPGKGNTLLNHCGIRPDLLEFTVDRNHHKHGKFLPGSRIPVLPPEAIEAARPDYVLVLPWNLRAEISAQLHYVADWGGQLVFAIPHLQIVEPGASGEGAQS